MNITESFLRQAQTGLHKNTGEEHLENCKKSMQMLSSRGFFRKFRNKSAAMIGVIAFCAMLAGCGEKVQSTEEKREDVPVEVSDTVKKPKRVVYLQLSEGDRPILLGIHNNRDFAYNADGSFYRLQLPDGNEILCNRGLTIISGDGDWKASFKKMTGKEADIVPQWNIDGKGTFWENPTLRVR